ncbi:MAG: ATP-binding cassette domain-containing protein [Bacteroidales bacterium]|jgi:ABC-2 type transport system ATP-binding protein|nr:ATP-binding cassette domain-containing protein [Bacteroidales bacterium]
MEMLNVCNVTKKYGDFTALNAVNVSVEEGSVFGLLGPNGAGKTSLIRIINRITAPDSGEVFFKGRKLSSEHVSQIGYLPEERGLYRKMKAGEHAVYLARLKGLSNNEATKRLKYWFDKFEIMSWWNKKVEELSKGMQQKLQFIVTVIHQPSLLIFDEPFSGFDPINVNLLKNEMLELRKKGATIIFSTHNMASVEELCDNIALIHKSEKILEGRISDIKNNNKENLFAVCFTNSDMDLRACLSDNIEIKYSELLPNGHTIAHLKIPEHQTSGDLIRLLPSSMQLISFNEILPSMNDIFISSVNADRPQQKDV